jgi:hypothetical protein
MPLTNFPSTRKQARECKSIFVEDVDPKEPTRRM